MVAAGTGTGKGRPAIIITVMNIIPYSPAAHRELCLALFDSNHPKFFTAEERTLFANYIDLPTLGDYFVIEDNDAIVACGGIYYSPEHNETGLAWGMVQGSLQGRGYGRALTEYRVSMMRNKYPHAAHKLNTSQHTVAFYEKMGFRTTLFTKDGFGPGYDRYDMEGNYSV